MTFQIGEDIVSGASYVLAAASELVKPLSRVETSLQGRVWKCSRWRMGLRRGWCWEACGGGQWLGGQEERVLLEGTGFVLRTPKTFSINRASGCTAL